MSTRELDPRTLLDGICGERMVLGGKVKVCVADVHDADTEPDYPSPYMQERHPLSSQHFMVDEYVSSTAVGLVPFGPSMGTCVACEATAVEMVADDLDGTAPGRRWPMCAWHAGREG